ncbi:MAG: hypothetical protein WC100_01425 [Sterolibacterium sp.]
MKPEDKTLLKECLQPVMNRLIGLLEREGMIPTKKSMENADKKASKDTDQA